MQRTMAHERVVQAAQLTEEEIKAKYKIPSNGYSDNEAEACRNKYGSNDYTDKKDGTLLKRIRRAFINPFTVVLIVIAVISLFTDVILQPGTSRNYMTVITISVMVLTSGIIRFIQEMRSKRISDELSRLVNTSVMVKRKPEWKKMESLELVVGDTVKLNAGDRIPADIRLTAVRDCFISQSAITGESGIQGKNAECLKVVPRKVNEFRNIAFMGSTIISGSCEGIVIAVGKDTIYGGFSSVDTGRKKGFDEGSNSIAWVLIKFMAILVPIVFVAAGITKGNWISAFIFALSVAVGLTPELLPMVITACLAKGSASMGQKQTVVKNINAMQGFGSMDVLCIDKTGTLTGDSLHLEYYMDVLGNESEKVLDLAVLNSFNHSGINNHLDKAVLKARTMPGREAYYSSLLSQWAKIDELPFDHNRKIATVLLNNNDKHLIISKGSVDDIVGRCSFMEFKGVNYNLGADKIENAHKIVDEMLEDGMKILAVAVKHSDKDHLSLDDEYGLTLIGFLAFFDSPKSTATAAIKKLKSQNVEIKVLTGDNAAVAESVCRRLKINTDEIITGSDFDLLDDNEVQVQIEKTSVFAELSPRQKEQIVSMLQSNGHTVGYLGDGMNDLPAVTSADVGISVDTASPAVKDAADVILLKKDLNVLEEGILEGRKAFANMSKYIKITASSNLGNIIAVVIASIFLPFFPMTSVQLLLLNLLYDILCLVLPWDKVDNEICSNPLDWSGQKLSRFMMTFGPISSIFDIITFVFLFNFLCPMLCGGRFMVLPLQIQEHFIELFHTGWFLESMWTQVLILHLLRTKKLPFIQSKPSAPVIIVTLVGTTAFTILAMTPLGAAVGLCPLPPVYFAFLLITVISYLLLVTLVKHLYIKRNSEFI